MMKSVFGVLLILFICLSENYSTQECQDIFFTAYCDFLKTTYDPNCAEKDFLKVNCTKTCGLCGVNPRTTAPITQRTSYTIITINTNEPDVTSIARTSSTETRSSSTIGRLVTTIRILTTAVLPSSTKSSTKTTTTTTIITTTNTRKVITTRVTIILATTTTAATTLANTTLATITTTTTTTTTKSATTTTTKTVTTPTTTEIKTTTATTSTPTTTSTTTTITATTTTTTTKRAIITTTQAATKEASTNGKTSKRMSSGGDFEHWCRLIAKDPNKDTLCASGYIESCPYSCRQDPNQSYSEICGNFEDETSYNCSTRSCLINDLVQRDRTLKYCTLTCCRKNQLYA